VDPAQVITVDTTNHTLTRVVLPPVQAVAASTGSNINLSPSSAMTSLDGVTFSATSNGAQGSDVLLLKDQATATQNGLYWANLVSPYTLNRCTEPLTPGRLVHITGGTVNAHTEWLLNTPPPIVVGTTVPTFSRQLVRANVKDFGARGNGNAVFDGQMSSSTNPTHLTCSTSTPFTAADVGKNIVIAGAGASGANLVTTISTYTSSSVVILATACSVSVTGANVQYGTDDSQAIYNAYSSISSGALTFPPGNYFIGTAQNLSSPGIPSTVQVQFEQGAILTPSTPNQVTINGQVGGHPTQQIFGGFGGLSAVTHTTGSGPAIVVSGCPNAPYSFAAQIVVGGLLSSNNVTFQYAINGGPWLPSTPQSTSGSSPPYPYTVPGTGVIINFPAGMYTGTGTGQDTYSWTSTSAIAIASTSSDKLSVKWWGATGNGSTDDTAALQASLTAAVASHVPLVMPATGSPYIISSTLTINTSSGSLQHFGFHWRGQVGTDPVSRSVVLQWNGPTGGTMLAIQCGEGSTIEDIHFNGNAAALYCVQLLPANAFNLRFVRCTFGGVVSYPYWQPNTSYVSGAIVLPKIINGGGGDIGYLYQAGGSGSLKSGDVNTINAWTITIGDTVTDDIGPGANITWMNIGPSPACFIVGDGTGTPISQCVWRDCAFGSSSPYTAAGWRCIGGGNVKDFYLDNCEFSLLGRGVDWTGSSGNLQVTFPSMEESQETDFYQGGGGVLTVVGMNSEASAAVLTGAGANVLTSARFIGGYWAGSAGTFAAPGSINYGATIHYGGALTISDSYLADGSNAFPHIMLNNAGAPNASGPDDSPSIFEAVNCAFAGMTENRFFDSSGNDILNNTTGGAQPEYKFEDVGIYLRGNTGSGTGGAEPFLVLPDVVGTNIRSNRQQVGLSEPNSQISLGITIKEQGYLTGSVYRIHVPYTAWIAAATSQVLNLGGLYPPFTIKEVYCLTTDGYVGTPTTPQLSLGRGQGTATSLLVAHDVMSAVNKPISTSDLGADFTSSPFGVLTSLGPAGESVIAEYPTATEDFIQLTMTATGAGSPNLGNGLTSNFTQGATDVVVVAEFLPKVSSLAGSFLPTSLSGCVLWLRSDMGVTQASGSVSKWADQSGQGNDCIQNTGANQPSVVSSWQNGQTGIRTTSTQWLASANFSSYGVLGSVILVCALANGSSTIVACDCRFSASDSLMILGEATNLIAFQDDSSTLGATTSTEVVSPCTIVGVGAITGNPTKSLFVNGQKIFTATVTGYGGQIDGFTVGNQNSHTTGGVTVGEMIVYDRQLSDGEVAALQAYLRAFWATPAS
jgi:hypothetical protein